MTASIRLNFLYIISGIWIYWPEYPIMYSIIAANYATFVLSVVVSPGYSKDEQLVLALKQRRIFQPNKIIFFEDNKCRTCKLDRPARSSHCSVCNECVLLMDHHCIWINNCVGYKNFKWFLGYLVTTFMILAYGMMLNCRYLIYHGIPVLSKMNLGNLKFGTKLDLKLLLGNYVHIYYNSWRVLVHAVRAKSDSQDLATKLAIIFVVICLLFGGIIVYFAGGIINNIGYHGMTENEKRKWRYIQGLIEYSEFYKYYFDDTERVLFQNETLKDTAEFVYLVKYNYYTPKPQKVMGVKNSLDIIKGYFKSDDGAVGPWENKMVKYFTFNSYNEKEVIVSGLNKARVKPVASILEIDNRYDQNQFLINLSVLWS